MTIAAQPATALNRRGGSERSRYCFWLMCNLMLFASIGSTEEKPSSGSQVNTQLSSVHADESRQPEVGYELTPGRRGSLVAATAGLTSVLLAGLSLAWGRFASSRRRAAAIIAGAAGLVGILLAARHLASATGELGSGSGRLGAIVAILLSLGGMVTAGFAVTRLRRVG